MFNDDEMAQYFPEIGGDWFLGQEHLGHWTPESVFSPWSTVAAHEGVVGTPEDDAANWVYQTTGFTCAVVSQQMILKQFGIDISEAELVYEATAQGWLHAGGTSPVYVGRLLEYHGIPCHLQHGVNVESLMTELAQGHKIIAGIDGGELSKQDFFFEDWFNPHGANHAVVVTGLDMRDPHHPLVVLNDLGHPQGAGMSYPLDEFLDAWADSGNMYLSQES